MKLCDTCIYRNENEYHKPCIVYRDDCEFYEREGDMTREEAIERLNAIKQFIGYDKDSVLVNATQKSIDMAIKALEQEPCDDLISREQALKECHEIVIDGDRYRIVQEETLLGLPPVTAEPKTGHWAINKGSLDALYGEVCKCSECSMESISVSDYCPNCGARMESEDEE